MVANLLLLIDRWGIQGLRIKTRQVGEFVTDVERTLSVDVAEVESKRERTIIAFPEVVIVGPVSTFRSRIFAYAEGMLVLESPLPAEILKLKSFEVAILKSRVRNKPSGPDEKANFVVRGSPVPGQGLRKVKLADISFEHFECIQDLLANS